MVVIQRYVYQGNLLRGHVHRHDDNFLGLTTTTTTTTGHHQKKLKKNNSLIYNNQDCLPWSFMDRPYEMCTAIDAYRG